MSAPRVTDQACYVSTNCVAPIRMQEQGEALDDLEACVIEAHDVRRP